jgi:hypothetical protein
MNIIHTKAKAASDAIHSFGVSASNTLKNLRDRISTTVSEIFNQVKEYFFGRQITQITFQASDIMGEHTVPNFTSDPEKIRAAAIAAREQETNENKVSEIEFEKRASALKPIVQKLVERRAAASLEREERAAAAKAVEAAFQKIEQDRKEKAAKRAEEESKREALYKARKEQLIAYKDQVVNNALPIAFAASACAMGYFYVQNKNMVHESIENGFNNLSNGVNQLVENLPTAQNVQIALSNWINCSINAIGSLVPSSETMQNKTDEVTTFFMNNVYTVKNFINENIPQSPSILPGSADTCTRVV